MGRRGEGNDSGKKGQLQSHKDDHYQYPLVEYVAEVLQNRGVTDGGEELTRGVSLSNSCLKINKKLKKGSIPMETNCCNYDAKGKREPNLRGRGNNNLRINRKANDGNGLRRDLRWGKWRKQLAQRGCTLETMLRHKVESVRHQFRAEKDRDNKRLMAVYRKIRSKRKTYRKGMRWRRGCGSNSQRDDRLSRTKDWVQGPRPLSTKYTRAHKKVTEKAQKQVRKLNKGVALTRPTEEFRREVGNDIITFEHLNVNGINTKGGFTELDHVMRVFQCMEAGVVSINEHTLDTTKPRLMKKVAEVLNAVDKYARHELSSNLHCQSDTNWKPGGTMLNISGKWASRWRSQGSDPLGRWSWMDLKGKGGKMIRVVSGYRVSQPNPKNVGPLTACQQQFNSLILENKSNLDPRKAFLDDLLQFLMKWKNGGDQNEIVLMMDANEDVAENKCLKKFVDSLGLLDSVVLMNPALATDQTYLWSNRRIDYVFISPGLQQAVVNAGHHPFHQHLVTDHKGVYVYFLTDVLFDTNEIDGSHFSQRRLDMSKRRTVD